MGDFSDFLANLGGVQLKQGGNLRFCGHMYHKKQNIPFRMVCRKPPDLRRYCLFYKTNANASREYAQTTRFLVETTAFPQLALDKTSRNSRIFGIQLVKF